MKYDLSYDVLDVISHGSYQDGPPYELYRQLRDEAPVIKCRGVEPMYTDEFWAITRHADVVEVSRKFQTYSPANKGSLMN